MAPLASRSSGHEDQGISPELMIAIAGLFVVFFVVILIAFCLPAKNSTNGCPVASDRRHVQCAHESCSHPHPTLRRGLALPTVSLPRCQTCHQHPRRASEKASRAPQESIRSPPRPPQNVNTRRHALTGSLPRLPSWCSSSAFGVPSFPMAPLADTVPSPPSGRPSIAYGARGPTATLRPVVW